eukprot:Blabericola_migrator_1__7221@NODE_3666_length_1591_cov_17_456693_g2272_i0_p1_GENE_NODE_3666_length_1591_cov_17_456693_g2272_i0NODE_3666_length_1591_cov_17_456693_g2272_i0_p1_ORF_typecomplete_len268_score46_89_NODE_3666_length_1591_cov_17_456693_g2272_i05011304
MRLSSIPQAHLKKWRSLSTHLRAGTQYVKPSTQTLKALVAYACSQLVSQVRSDDAVFSGMNDTFTDTMNDTGAWTTNHTGFAASNDTVSQAIIADAMSGWSGDGWVWGPAGFAGLGLMTCLGATYYWARCKGQSEDLNDAPVTVMCHNSDTDLTEPLMSLENGSPLHKAALSAADMDGGAKSEVAPKEHDLIAGYEKIAEQAQVVLNLVNELMSDNAEINADEPGYNPPSNTPTHISPALSRRESYALIPSTLAAKLSELGKFCRDQ